MAVMARMKPLQGSILTAKLIAFTTTTTTSVGLWEQNAGVWAAALQKAAWNCYLDFVEALGATQLSPETPVVYGNSQTGDHS